MAFANTIPLKRERKGRYNFCMYPSDMRRIDELSRKLGCSRSELLLFCFNYFEASTSADRDEVRADG